MDKFTKNLEAVKEGTVSIIGIPLDHNSSFMTGTADAPGHIREALRSISTNMSTESIRDLDKEARLIDLGDLEINPGTPSAYIDDIRLPISKLLARGTRILSLGGDHSITYPIIKAYREKYPSLTILHLDAHPDLYHLLEGSPYSHACPFARIMEENLADRLVQIGIRTMTPHQKEQALRFNVETLHIKDHQDLISYKPSLKGPIYLSVDLDILDPAFAPGISHYEPGGLSTRQVIHIIQNLNCPIVGADIVELNPTRDRHNMTAMAAAKFLKEIADKMLF